MIPSEVLREIVNDQKSSYFDETSIGRSLKFPKKTKAILIISGIRRCGKSTLIKNKFLHAENSLYLNFEDPRLINFDLSDFSRLEDLMEDKKEGILMLDEIQNIDRWELYARSAHERGISLVITGSNASLLSRELGTKLTGRYKQLELFPFNFSEFLDYFKLERNLKSFDEYFKLGGFPEFLEEKDPDYHRLLLRDIVTRDIALRRNLPNETQLMRLAIHLLSNTGKDFSYNNLSKLLEIKSVRTVIDYCDYLSESYLVEYIPLYSHSIKKQIANPKKVYAIDNAFARSNSLSFNDDYGRRLENIVYLKLRQAYRDIYYFRTDKSECDFLVRENEKDLSAIQVCWKIDNDNLSREIKGLKDAMNAAGIKNGMIITYDQEDVLDGVGVVPGWKWL
jgi:predicted AAA+ superfamily ATPase